MPYRIPSRAPRSSEIVESLRVIAAAEELNEFALRKLERDARGLMNADAVCAHTVLGAVASLRGAAEDVRRHHQIALNLSGGSAEAHRNYSVSLAELGEMTEAFKVALEACRRVPGDAEMLHEVIGMALESAHFREGRDLCGHWNESFSDQPLPYESMMRKLAGAVDREVFSEESVQEILRITHGIMRASNVRKVKDGVLGDHTDPDSFLYELHVLTSPDQAVRLNEELANRIVARPDLMEDPGLKFVPVFIGTIVDAGHTEATARGR